ncbi:MAG: hypothetical protein LUH07_04855 [Lachnospiraceae bacterium]|nr:hypothetical protein [Lachnospiraceae bacterium]
MEKGTFEYFQSEYERMNELLYTYQRLNDEYGELSEKEARFDDIRVRLVIHYPSKYESLPFDEDVSKTCTDAELRRIELELSNFDVSAFLKRNLFLKSTRERYFDLMEKLIVIIRYLRERTEQITVEANELMEQLSNMLVDYEGEYRKVREKAGCLPSSKWDSYQITDTSNGRLLLGDVHMTFCTELPVKDSAFSLIYKDNQLCLPYVWSADAPMQLAFRYREADAQAAVQMIYSLLLQMLRSSTEFFMEFHLMDGVAFGQDFGDFRDLQKLKKWDVQYLNKRVTGGNFRLARLSLGSNSISEDLAGIDAWMKAVADELRGYKTLTEYNHARGDNDRIPYQTVVVDNYPVGFDEKDIEILNRIILNGKKLGIFVILMIREDLWEETERKAGIELGSLTKMLLTQYVSKELVTVDLTEPVPCIRLAGKQYPCTLQRMEDEQPDYIHSFMSALMKEKPVNNRFEKLYNLEEPFGKLSREAEWTGGDGELHIPFAVAGRGEIVDYCLGEALNAHGLICGAKGSGKSALLDMLISSIVVNYDPRDVEIWLAGYDIGDFFCFGLYTPPHIRLIGASDTPDFTYAFIDRITEEMGRRQKIIAEADYKYKTEGGKYNITSCGDCRRIYGIYSMPRLVIFVNNFSLMIQHAQEKPDYMRRLETILMEARDLGISMLFSDSSIVEGLRGLSDKSKKQIGARIVLSNDIEELREVLGENDREKLLSFVHMKVGQLALQTVEINDNEEEVRTIERARAIYINVGWILNVNEKARTFYHAEDYEAEIM